LLRSEADLSAFSNCARKTVKKFNYDVAADGIIAAIEYLDRNPLAGK
jgi:hypothetical protein